MNQQYIENNHIVDKYLQGQLSEKELNEFEEYFFEHPQMLEELTIAKAMQTAMREESNHLQPSRADKVKVNWFDWVFQPKLGFALSAVLAVGLVTLWNDNNRLKGLESAVLPASSLVLSQSRGANSESGIVKIARNQSAIAVQVVTGPIGYPEVELELKDGSGKVLWHGKSKVDGPIGTINLVLMTRKLTAGDYTLSVFSPTNTLNALLVHSFKVELI